MHIALKILYLATIVIWTNATTASSLGEARPILIDTDIMSDVDDVGAITIANVLNNCGLANLLGIAINTHSKYGSLAANALCNYFDNGDVPIAAIRPITNQTFFDDWDYTLGEYASKVAYNWPRTVDHASSTMTPVELYRSVLNAAEDGSVNVISVGFLTNLADLLQSEADDISGMSGVQLAQSKVRELVIMGGMYPSGWEFNFGGEDPASTAYVLEHWPSNVPVIYSGGELGGNIFSGQHLAEHSPPNSPVLAAYQWYVGRCSTIRESWDPLTVLYGILGLEGFSKIGIKPPLAYANEFGYNKITSSNGSNAWVNDTSVTNQHWLRLADGVKNTSVAWLLDQFFTHDPVDHSCFRQSSISCMLQAM